MGGITMRLQISKSKNAQSFYVIRSCYINGKHSSKVVEKLGTYEELKKKHDDTVAWAKEYIQQLNELEKEQKREIVIHFKQSKPIPMDKQLQFSGGYLFLQSLYHQLGLPAICQDISSRYKFKFNLNECLSRLIYIRILYPSSKLSSYEYSKKMLEPHQMELHHLYRSLGILSAEDSFIQSQLYANSERLCAQNSKVLYYDCTNFFFEIEQEDGIRQYGPSKEHRSSLIVEMGLFMDGDGIPLAYCLHSGDTNEQVTLQPLEEKIVHDFNLSRFIVCTDGGISSLSNRKFNTRGERAFVTTQSIKNLKAHLKQWALDPKGWKMSGTKKEYDLTDLDALGPEYEEMTFFKDRWIQEDGLEQHLIVTFSLKYRHYQQNIREQQIQRASNGISTHSKSLKAYGTNDYKRFVKKTKITVDGEVAKKELYEMDDERIRKESQYDGFYAVCISLDESPEVIIRINQRRWEIEESFRLMKTEFKARSVYLSREDRIRAHFLICFLSLTLYRLLEKKLGNSYTPRELIHTLQDMNFLQLPIDDYVPAYTRTEITDAIQNAFGFRTDYEVLSEKQMKKILRTTKKI